MTRRKLWRVLLWAPLLLWLWVFTGWRTYSGQEQFAIIVALIITVIQCSDWWRRSR